MNTVAFAGRNVAQLGQGTWQMGDDAGRRREEIAALQRGIELGMTVIDTAEMYGSGLSESLVGEAIQGRRDRVTLVSKVLPSHASAAGTLRACEASLQRLGVESLDLYLLHWRGSHPLAETVSALERLQQQGKIHAWGVSNFDVNDMEELFQVEGGRHCATNQVLYNPEYRGIEFDLLPWCEQHGIAVMAYSPIGQGGGLLRAPVLTELAQKHRATPAQVALAWCLRQPVLAIPKAGTVQHVESNAAAPQFQLSADDLAAIDRVYPAPRRKQALAML